MTSHGSTLPETSHHQILDEPSSNTAAAIATPALWLTLPDTARPRRDAKATAIPNRSTPRPASSGCRWYQQEAAAVQTNPVKNRAANAYSVWACPRLSKPRKLTSPAMPHAAKARLLNTSSALGMLPHARPSAKACWCAGCMTAGPNKATAKSAAIAASISTSLGSSFTFDNFNNFNMLVFQKLAGDVQCQSQQPKAV